jgi:hypothetical protein
MPGLAKAECRFYKDICVIELPEFAQPALSRAEPNPIRQR